MLICALGYLLDSKNRIFFLIKLTLKFSRNRVHKLQDKFVGLNTLKNMTFEHTR